MAESDARLPAHVEVAGLIRNVQAQGGFAAVLKRGDADAGTILLVLSHKGAKATLYERMPQLDGAREWQAVKSEDIDNKQEFSDYIARRGQQDADVWIVELDIANPEQLIGSTGYLS